MDNILQHTYVSNLSLSNIVNDTSDTIPMDVTRTNLPESILWMLQELIFLHQMDSRDTTIGILLSKNTRF